jgi:glycosyltransferase involved in cell wall biosynthesis
VIIELAGGSGMFLRNLAKGLRRHFTSEFDLALLSLRDRGIEPEDRRIFSSIRILGADVNHDWRRVFQVGAHARGLRKTIEEFDPDLILNIGTYPNLLVPLVVPRRRCILTAHSNSSHLLDHSPFKNGLKPLIRWRYGRWPVVVPSEGVADDLRRNFSVSNVRVIGHGVDANHIRELSAQPVNDLPDQRYIVTVGRLTAAKDHATLLRAFALARQQGLGEHLLIVGGGGLCEMLERLACELGVANHVHFVGHRDNPYPYMRRAEFFVLSSVFEGFGLALAEAMTLGLACIATDCPSGPGEILGGGEYGVVVPPANPRALAEAMLRLALSPQLKNTLSRQALCRAERFTLRRMVEQYRELFLEQALAAGRSIQ